LVRRLQNIRFTALIPLADPGCAGCDWDYFAREAGDAAWNYDSVLKIYRQIEDWQGAPDPDHRGTGGLLFINSGIGSGPFVPAMFEGTRSVRIPTFDSINGRMMEGPGGCSLVEIRMRDWQRLSIFRSYTFPYMGTAIYLASQASDFVTGTTLFLDGGFAIR
jgi:choline dehydrogenase-like flavoprotein